VRRESSPSLRSFAPSFEDPVSSRRPRPRLVCFCPFQVHPVSRLNKAPRCCKNREDEPEPSRLIPPVRRTLAARGFVEPRTCPESVVNLTKLLRRSVPTAARQHCRMVGGSRADERVQRGGVWPARIAAEEKRNLQLEWRLRVGGPMMILIIPCCGVLLCYLVCLVFNCSALNANTWNSLNKYTGKTVSIKCRHLPPSCPSRSSSPVRARRSSLLSRCS
jgi:hypothetical protein